MQQELVKESEKDAMRTCFSEEDKDGFDSCMGQMKDAEEVAGELFRGVSDERKQNKEKRAKEEAAVEVVGERFQLCMEASTTEEEKKGCRDEMGKGAGMAGLKEDVEDVVKKYHRISPQILEAKAWPSDPHISAQATWWPPQPEPATPRRGRFFVAFP